LLRLNLECLWLPKDFLTVIATHETCVSKRFVKLSSVKKNKKIKVILKS